MAYDAIRDTLSSRSSSATPMLDTHYPFHSNPANNGHGRTGLSPQYQEVPSPHERQPYPGQYERQASSRPGSSGGLRGLLNDDEEPGAFPERRSSGSTQGQVPTHRREYRHPSIGSVLGGAGSPGSMGEGRSLSMLLNGPAPMATPSSTTAMTPGMTPSHYPSPSPLGSNAKSPRFAVPTSSGGHPREYPFPPTPTGSSQHTSQRSPALYGLYNPQKSPTYQSRPLPPATNAQTGFPLSGYRPPSRGPAGKAPSPSPSVTSIHNLISSSDAKPYRSPSTEPRSLYGAVGQTRTATPSDTHSMPISRSTSGGLLLEGQAESRDSVRRSSGRFEGTVSPDGSERRSSILGWTGEPASTPSRSSNLNGLISPSNEPELHHVIPRSRRLSVIELASPTHTSLEVSPVKTETNGHSVAGDNEMMDVEIPDGASALDVLASLSERAGSGRARHSEQHEESASDIEDVQLAQSKPAADFKKEETMDDSDDSYDEVTTETVDNERNDELQAKEEEKPVVPETVRAETVSRRNSSESPIKMERTDTPPATAELSVLSPSARVAPRLEKEDAGPQISRQKTPVDLAAQIFPADEKPEPLPEPAVEPAHSGKTEYKPHRRLTAPLSVLKPLSAEDKAWYLDARNCLNPLRKGCPFRTMAEGKDRPSGPPGGEGASSSLSGRKRARDSPYTNGDGYQEEDNGWALKRARRGPAEALNEQSEVAAHYNARGNTGRTERTQSVTYGLKKCNNWIKSILINRFTRRRPGVTNFDTRDRDARPNGRVLDMGCGKGGDIEKWNRLKIDEYVGIDVASGSIQDFDERIRTYKKRLWFRPHLFVLDCFSFPITVAVPRKLLEPKFDTISMQFCMHYAFESETKVRQMLSNISDSLRTGGTFLGTTLSASKVLGLLAHIPEESEELKIGNPYYNIVFEKRDYEGVYGHSYRFTLAEAVEDCSEYIVHWDAFRELALSYGLKEIYSKDFDQVYAEESLNPESAQLAERMEVTRNGALNMDPEQWSACSIYMAFAFIKVS